MSLELHAKAGLALIKSSGFSSDASAVTRLNLSFDPNIVSKNFVQCDTVKRERPNCSK